MKRSVPSVVHYLARGKDQYDWLIPNRLRQGVLGILSGDPKCGKTTLIYNTAIDIMLEGTAWGVECKPFNFIHLDYETDPNFIKQNMFMPRNLSENQIEQVGKYLFATDLADPEEKYRLPAYVSVEYLDEIVREKESGLVVIDTLRGGLTGMEDLKPGWDFDSSTVRKIIQPFLYWSRKTNWTILLLCHNNKTGGMYGSVDFQGVADQLISLTRNGDGTKLSFTGRTPAIPDLFFKFEEGIYKCVGEVGRKDIREQIVTLAKNQKVITITNAREAIIGDNNTISKMFNQLIEEGTLVSLGYNKGYQIG